MDARAVARILGAVVLLAADLSQADNAGRIEPLGGIQSMTSPATTPGIRSEPNPLRAAPQGDVLPQATTPFGSPLPPNNLTPAPLLPFNPNRSLMPSPSTPAPSSNSGRIGR